MIDLLIALIALIITIALIIAVFRISAATRQTAELTRELLALQIMRDNLDEKYINTAAAGRLIAEGQRKYLLNAYRERNATTPPPPAAQ